MHKTVGAVNRKQEARQMQQMPKKGIKRKSKSRKKFGKQGKTEAAVEETRTLKQ
jgi:hypothetical protein